jgi:Spy/CpxP family protein refolding chaperone
MKKFIKNITVTFFLLVIVCAAGVSKSEAARFGHGSGDDLKLISSLELNAQEQASLQAALSAYGPAVKSAFQNLRTKKKQLEKDLEASTPDGNLLAVDASAVAGAKAQLKAARTQINSALSSAITPEHLQKLRAELAERLQNRIDAKTARLLSEYARNLEKQ